MSTMRSMPPYSTGGTGISGSTVMAMRSGRAQRSPSAEVVPVADNTTVRSDISRCTERVVSRQTVETYQDLGSGSFLRRNEFPPLVVLDRDNHSFQNPLKIQ